MLNQSTKTKLLIVDDDREFRETLVKTLNNQGYQAVGLDTPDPLPVRVEEFQPNVVLLDLMFGTQVLGLDACRRLRTWSAVPVIILSVVEDELTKVEVLDAGADDYLSKPFGISELLARVRAVQRRLDQNAGRSNEPVELEDLTIDLAGRSVTLKNQQIHLTPKEYLLLKALSEAKGRIVTYEKLISEIWHDNEVHERAEVRGLVMRLRKKLNEDLSQPRYILMEAGVGYRLNLAL